MELIRIKERLRFFRHFGFEPDLPRVMRAHKPLCY
jgi:hypothetical protein